MNTLPKPILAMVISFSFQNRAVCRRWRDTVKYTFDDDDFEKICAHGTVSVLHMFLEQYPAQKWKRGSKIISTSGNLDLLKFIRNNYSHDDHSILAKACLRKHLHIVKYLIEKGAEVCNNSLYYAYMGGCDEIIKIVHEHHGGLEMNRAFALALAGAAAGGHEELAMPLLEKVCVKDRNSFMFESACCGGNLKIVSVLVDTADNAEEIDYCLYLACKKKRTEVVHFLIQNGANDWNLGLDGACESGCVELIQLMIQHGADDWNRGMITACKRNFVDIFSLMVQHGADEWEEGFFYACKHDSIDTVREILSRKSLDITDGIEIARKNRSKKILRFFGK